MGGAIFIFVADDVETAIPFNPVRVTAPVNVFTDDTPDAVEVTYFVPLASLSVVNVPLVEVVLTAETFVNDPVGAARTPVVVV